MVDGQPDSDARKNSKELQGRTTVTTTMKCIIQNSVEAYRKQIKNDNAILDSLVILDLTCQIYKDEQGNSMYT